MSKSKETSHIRLIILLNLGLFGILIGTLFVLWKHIQQDSPLPASESVSVSVSESESESIKTKPSLPHINPLEAYNYLQDFSFKKVKNTFPSIEIVREIPKDYVRPRRTRKYKIKTSEEGVLATLYALYPENPLDMCVTPCSLNTNVSEQYNIIIYKHGFLPSHTYLDTGVWPDENPIEASLGINWLQTFEEQKKCFDQNEDRLSRDRDAEVCKRHPPKMPPQARKSGRCRVMFNVSKTGYPRDVQALNCTDPVFKAASISSVRSWYYYPKIEKGNFVEQKNVRSKVSYRLRDENGEIIPE